MTSGVPRHSELPAHRSPMRCASALSFLALTAALAAQQPLLQATAAEARWLLPVADALAVAVPPGLDARAPATLVVAADGSASVRATAATADAPMLQLEVLPAAWLQQLGDRGRELPREWRNRIGGAARLAKVPTKPVLDAADGLFACVRDLERVAVTVQAARDGQPATVQATAVPRSGSPLAAWCALLQPAKTAAPEWPSSWAFAQLRLHLASESLGKALAPMAPLLAAVVDVPADELTKRVGWFDGRVSVALGDEQLALAFGLRSAPEFVAMLSARPAEQDHDGARTVRQPAAAYRDVAVLHTTTESRTPLPKLADADGVLHACGGLVGSTWLHTIGPAARGQLERAVDDALAGHMQPTAAPAAWLQLDVDLARLRPLLGAGTEGLASTGGVRHIALSGHSTTTGAPTTLHFTATLR